MATLVTTHWFVIGHFITENFSNGFCDVIHVLHQIPTREMWFPILTGENGDAEILSSPSENK